MDPQSSSTMTPSASLSVSQAPSEAPVTPSSHGTPDDLEPFLQPVLLELKKDAPYLAATVQSFEDEDISSDALLVTLYESSLAGGSALETFNQFKTRITVGGGRPLSTIFWVLLATKSWILY